MNRPVVDTHLHFWERGTFAYPWMDDEWQFDYLPRDWRDDAREVDVVATVHLQAEVDHGIDPVQETAWLASLAAAGDVPTVCVGYADLRRPDLDDVLDRHQAFPLFRGIRQHTWLPDTRLDDRLRTNLLDDPIWVAALPRLASRGLSFDLLLLPYQLQQAAAVFGRVPELVVVLEHVAVPHDPDPAHREIWRKGMLSFAQRVPNSLLKISALTYVSANWSIEPIRSIVHEALEIFGPDRCMFGSNFPIDRRAISYSDLWAAYGDFTADLTKREQDSVFVGNATRAYRLQDVS
jgi:predicted TIM-barrel fold metal-dependent hydrolase